MREGDPLTSKHEYGEFPWIKGLCSAMREALESGMERGELARRIGGLLDMIADDVERKAKRKRRSR